MERKSWKDKPYDSNTLNTIEELTKYNKLFDKITRLIDYKISSREICFLDHLRVIIWRIILKI
jgi:hypothetical protein